MQNEIINSLSKKELKVLEAIKNGLLNSEDIKKALNLSEVEVAKSLMFLENKGLIKREIKRIYTLQLTDFGKKYLTLGFPEEILISYLKNKGEVEISKIISDLSNTLTKEEISGAIGRLKKSNIIEIKDGKVKLISDPSSILNELNELRSKILELMNKSFEESELNKIKDILNLLKERKCIEIYSKSIFIIKLTDLGKSILEKFEKIEIENVIDKLTPEIILSGSWKDKKFRKYDVVSPVPKIYGGSFHHFREFIKKIKEIMLSLGFKEMRGNWIETAFWNFDIMFQPQDHPAREQHDTFYLNKKGKLPKFEIVAKVAYEHEVGYKYTWDHEIAKKLVLRTHTTAVSFKTMAKLTLVPPVKYFCVGRVFRNEAIDATHLPEFHQVEGIVIDEDLTFRDLLGILKEFYLKLGLKVKFMPSYFPYTEPSVQVMAYHEKLGKWIEMGGAGIFRKECLRPLSINYPVLAFGLGLERLAMFFYELDDIRKVFGNQVDLEYIRKYKVKIW